MSDALSDEFLPSFDVESSHSIHVDAPPPAVYRAARELDMSRSRLIRVLFRVRGLPTAALNRSGLARIRFKSLAERPDRGFVLGLIGQFWTPTGGLIDFEPDLFAAFATPGYAKATWSFSVSETVSGATLLTTVTRVRCLDESSRRRFRAYWFLIRPFSSLVRREVLRALRAASESSVALGST